VTILLWQVPQEMKLAVFSEPVKIRDEPARVEEPARDYNNI
jgi:hypothetical protein